MAERLKAPLSKSGILERVSEVRILPLPKICYNIFMFGFASFGVDALAIIDILVVAILVYAVILLFEKAHSLFLFNGIAILFLVYVAARYLNLHLTTTLFNAFFGFVAIILAVVFQRELRRFFEWLSAWNKFPYAKREIISEIVSNEIIHTVNDLANAKTGALIVLQGDEAIESFLENGIFLGGKVSRELLLSIFDTSSPGHDGAVIITGDRVKMFGAHLPLARKAEATKNFGTRHRAALGLAERSDALVIAVSEEKGTVSLAENGEIKAINDENELAFRIHDFLRTRLLEETGGKTSWIPQGNMREKIVALAIAVLLWFALAS